jgi:hypothetical protein
MAKSKKPARGKKATAGKGAKKATRKAVKATTKKKPAAKAAPAARKAAPVKLNDRQRDFLRRIGDAGAAGFTAAKSAEQRTIDALLDRKLVKKGARNKETGKTPYFLTKAAQKHLPAAPPAPPLVAVAEPAPMIAIPEAVPGPAPELAPAPPQPPAR